MWCSSLWVVLLLWTLLFFSSMEMVRSTEHGDHPPGQSSLTDLFTHRSFSQTFVASFGGSNVRPSKDGMGSDIILTNFSGSGFISRDKYYYGFFSTALKLPSSYSAGVVVAFYVRDLISLSLFYKDVSNTEVYPHNHDELDFELLEHEKRKDWTLQTNIYGNGSVSTGREEKFRLWFDPTEDFHYYSIIWNNNHIVFLVDNVPVREVKHNQAMSTVYPSKPMSVYSTIWDGSVWATHGGKKPINYDFSPFVASFKDMEMEGCICTNMTTCCSNGYSDSPTTAANPLEGKEFVELSQQQQIGMKWARENFMFYSYCNDPGRYKNKILPSECVAS